ncbi:fibropellin-1-like [Orbicella faveolata]|uniref:fibropellin-1-like n=1 Tax=Orbicella faveolata TaxID=48498 RepID=UPI0009E34099|nr:fibropellin-1-like [Orbicella faveolata]
MEQLILCFVFLATHLVFCEDDCRMLRFSSPVEGAALQKHVIKRIALDSEHSCRVHCYLENTCVSYNFGKRASGEDVCELNNATHTEHPSDLKTTSNFIYRGSENFCSSMPCRNRGTCLSGFSPHGYRCLCNDGFTGLWCEIDINECASNPCRNGGKCSDLANGFKCDCPTGFGGFQCETVIPECSQYKFLSDYDRHRNYYNIYGRKCDNDLTEDWYRFYGQAGTVMASSCVPTHKCHTDLTGWMKGSLPTVDEGVVLRKVCFHGFGICCHRDVEINVRNCGPFYVYRLKKLTFCNSRYCGSN